MLPGRLSIFFLIVSFEVVVDCSVNAWKNCEMNFVVGFVVCDLNLRNMTLIKRLIDIFSTKKINNMEKFFYEKINDKWLKLKK